MLRIPGWLALILFLPLQIWFAYHLLVAWGFWVALLFFLVLGFVANRAARAPWVRELFFPGSAYRWERRRHIYQGILFLAAAATFLLPRMEHAWLGPGPSAWVEGWPQPWLPAMFALVLVKASLR